MNKRYVPDNQEDTTNGVYEQLKYIYFKARKNDKDFMESNYRWSLGVCVINDIANELMFKNEPDMPMQLFGIPVGRDYPNPQKIELWKNITDECLQE